MIDDASEDGILGYVVILKTFVFLEIYSLSNLLLHLPLEFKHWFVMAK